MPRGDGTGPAGFGPMTGRAAGYCAGYSVPGFMNPVGGRGFWGYGRGFGGGGRGWRHRFWATGVPGWAAAGAVPYAGPQYFGATAPVAQQNELDFLKAQAESFTGALENISKRISELEKAEKEKK